MYIHIFDCCNNTTKTNYEISKTEIADIKFNYSYFVRLNSKGNIIILYSRGSQREETREPTNILINVEEPKWKKSSYYYIYI